VTATAAARWTSGISACGPCLIADGAWPWPESHNAGIACDDLFIVHDHVARGVRTAARHRLRLSDDPTDPAAADADADADADAEEAGLADEDDASLDGGVLGTAAAAAATDDADLEARLMVAWRGRVAVLSEAKAGHRGLIGLHPKAWGCPPHS